MKDMKKWPLLLYLLSKRLYKKVSFLIVLAVLVAVTVFCTVAFRQDSSMLKMALVAGENPPEAVTQLVQSEGAAAYLLYSREAAHRLLEQGQVDGVLEFAENFDGALDAFLSGKEKTPPLKLTVREKTIFLNLAMERVYAQLYPVLARQYYHTYAGDTLGFTDRQALEKAYDSVTASGEIVEFSYYNSQDRVEDTNYLLTPLRGILAAVMLFAGMASALYFLGDWEKGNLDATPMQKRPYMQLMYVLAGTLNVMIFVFLSLAVSGLLGNVGWELLTLTLYALACTGFSAVISGLTGKSTLLAAVMPILTMGVLAVCPVFLNVRLPYLAWLFPTYWYLTAAYNTAQLLPLAGYCLAVYVLSFVLWRQKRL